MQPYSVAISGVALAVSLFTLWFSILRRGKVCSTHPAFIAIRYDFVGKKFPQAKIFLRSLLYSTGKRGRVVESLFLRVNEGARNAEFSFWGYGDKDLVRGAVSSSRRKESRRTIISTLCMRKSPLFFLAAHTL